MVPVGEADCWTSLGDGTCRIQYKLLVAFDFKFRSRLGASEVDWSQGCQWTVEIPYHVDCWQNIYSMLAWFLFLPSLGSGRFVPNVCKLSHPRCLQPWSENKSIIGHWLKFDFHQSQFLMTDYNLSINWAINQSPGHNFGQSKKHFGLTLNIKVNFLFKSQPSCHACLAQGGRSQTTVF